MRYLIALCALVVFGAQVCMAAPELSVIPTPRSVKASAGGFDAAKATTIVVSGDDAGDRFSAHLLRDALLHDFRRGLLDREMRMRKGHHLSLSAGSGTKMFLIKFNGDEAYDLHVEPEGIEIESPKDAGLFYGVQTLIQLLEQARREKSNVAAVEISDSPTFAWRGRYYDASQYAGTIVTTRANLEHEIKLQARYKLNFLCLDLYNLVPFKSFPYCADANTLPAGDWDYLVELAHRYHVTLIPSLQSFSQMYPVIWTCDEGKPYRETTAGGLICPSRPENVKFLQGLYKDLITTFKYSPILGVGCSEVGMAWGKNYCPLCKARIDKGETLHDIYAKHVRDCVLAVDAAAKEVGRDVRPMMWGDEFYMGYGGEWWVGIDAIPKNTIMGHWMYWKPYDGIGGLLDRGYDVLFLSATYQHTALYLVDLSPQEPADGKWAPLLDSGVRNVTDQARGGG